MKKIVSLILIISLLGGCGAKPTPEVENNNLDGQRFKAEYSVDNGQKNEEGMEYPKVEISADIPIQYATNEQVKALLTSGTGVIYFGYPQCPWCRNVVPVFAEALAHQSIETVYYYNNEDQRDKKALDSNGNIVVEKEGSKEYADLLTLLGDFTSEYEGLNDPMVKRLYFPTIVMVKEGKIVFLHESTVDSQTNPYEAMSKEQQKELTDLYNQGFNALQSGCAVEKKC